MIAPCKRHLRRRKVLAALLAIFILCNAIGALPAFASPVHQQTPEGWVCWPFWPFCSWVPSTPTPTPAPGTTPAPGATPAPPGSTPGAPGSTPTPGGTPFPKPKQLPASSSFTMTATKIVGTNAHLDLLSDPAHPVLTFARVTIVGLKITHLSVTLAASGTVTGTGASIKTSLFQEVTSALGSFANKADLLVLTLGGTVPTLVMNNVSLQVDRYMDLQSGTLPGLSARI